MKLAPPPLAIGPNDGFEKTDLFGYRDFGERFVHIVEALDSATVILLDGPWGSGKTTFTQQWAGLLRHRGHAVVQFDAFANDYEDDAFIALAGAMNASSRDGKTEVVPLFRTTGVFRRKWNTESGGSGTSNPEEVEHRIRRKWNIESGGSGTSNPEEVEHRIRRKWNIESGGSGTAVPEVVNARR